MHDKVHEAALALMPTAELTDVHWRIGKFFLKRVNDSRADESLFSAVNHLNEAKALLSPEERTTLGLLNRRAAEEAQRSTAYDIAME